MRVHVSVCELVFNEMCEQVHTFVSLCFVRLYVCVLMCVHEGADRDGKGYCHGQGQTRETLFTRERWTGRWGK